MTCHDLTGRWWYKVNLLMDDWLRIVKLIELELSTRKIATQLELPYMIVWKEVMVIRHAIFCHADDANKILMSGEIELDESYFGGRRKGNWGCGASGKVPVFWILTREGKVHVEVVPNVQAETLLGITVKKVHRGSIVYTSLRQFNVLRLSPLERGSLIQVRWWKSSHLWFGRLLVVGKGAIVQIPWNFTETFSP